jgi:ATP-dependent Lon protease
LEANYNLVELGPRETGKSYAYQELSPYTILLTGPTTVANLFFNMASGKMGLVGIWDAIGFDEAADLQKMPKEVVTTLKTTASRGHSPVERIPCPVWLLSPCSGTRTSRSK